MVRARSTSARVPGAARAAAVQGDLGGRRRQVAQPRRGPAAGLRGSGGPRTTPRSRKPLDPAQFIDELREEMRTELTALQRPRCPAWAGWTSPNAARRGDQARPRWTPLPEPRNLRRLKTGDHRTGGASCRCIDMLKETVLRTGCLDAGHPGWPAAATIDREVLAERLLLLIYAYGTNTGIRAVAAGEPRPHRGRPALRAAPLPVRRGRPGRSPRRSPTPPSPPARPAVGRGLDRGRLRLHPLRRVRPEHLHRVALPLRRPRRADLLARRDSGRWRSTPS